jgi:hypothetical protein
MSLRRVSTLRLTFIESMHDACYINFIVPSIALQIRITVELLSRGLSYRLSHLQVGLRLSD